MLTIVAAGIYHELICYLVFVGADNVDFEEDIVNVTLSTSSNFVYESGNITITCNATSQVNFSLFIDGTFDSTKFERITAHQLTPLAMAYVFSNATIDDNGTTFMCYGFNDTVESNSSIFYLNVYCKCIIIMYVNY